MGKRNCFRSDVAATAEPIITWFIVHQNIEVTFQEMGGNLGLEGQRQEQEMACYSVQNGSDRAKDEGIGHA